MDRVTVWLISLMLMLSMRPAGAVGVQSPAQSLEIPVSKITGFSGTLTRGMRVDVLFLAAGTDGAPTIPRHLHFALRNAEVISSVWARDSGGGIISQRTTLRLPQEDVRAIKALPST